MKAHWGRLIEATPSLIAARGSTTCYFGQERHVQRSQRRRGQREEPSQGTRLAREQGTIFKDWGGRLPVALVYPNAYHVGMSSLGLQTLYRLLNARSDIVCERAFWEPQLPLVSYESRRPLSDFAAVAVSISYEMDYPHLVHLLGGSGIPLWAKERDETWPLVLAGGPAVSANPLPVADFLDAVAIGEGEPVLDALVQTIWDTAGGSRQDAWQALARIPGLYVPALPQHPPVDKQWLADLDAVPTSSTIHTPDTEFGNMHLIEISRGCVRGCRFCLAGYLCRPKRERSVETVLQQAREGLQYVERIGLVGAAVSDYSAIDELATRLRDLGASLSVSSLRVDPLSEPLLAALEASGTSTLTLAPEAGSERLRRLIHKGVTEADLIRAAQRASQHGFRQLKLYFMLGLPTEEDRDVDAIAALCEEAARYFSGRVTANITPFVPKAHTPFQWSEMTPHKVVAARLRTLEKRLRRQGIAVKSESPRWAEIQGLLARGDRRLAAVLAALHGVSRPDFAQRGPSIRDWKQALHDHGLQIEACLGPRAMDARLPWDLFQTGTSRRHLLRQWQHAQARGTPPDQVSSRDTRTTNS
jgi:radical SAM superfamily enzyme YgiQ (UPF0313 family)